MFVLHTVFVLCGGGGNGDGRLVAARRLHGWGVTVTVGTSGPPDEYTDVPAHQMALIRRLGVPVRRIDPEDDLPEADLLLDALIGYGLDGDPDDEMVECIRQVIWHGALALSLDIPSGLNATTGVPSDTTVRGGHPHPRPSQVWARCARRPIGRC